MQAVKDTGITDTVFAGYADTYAGYVTTREEYEKQHNEGGSTHFGPCTLGDFRQTFHRLATTLADANAQPWPHPEPKDSRTQAPDSSGVTVLADAAPLGKNFGDIKRDAKASYKPGTAVRVEFLGPIPTIGSWPMALIYRCK